LAGVLGQKYLENAVFAGVCDFRDFALSEIYRG
jgi:hypothetical protein